MAEGDPQLAGLAAEIEQLACGTGGRFDPVRCCFLQQQSQRLQRQRHCSAHSLQRLADALGEYRQRLAQARDNARQALGESPEPALLALFEAGELRELQRRLRGRGSETPLRHLGQRHRQPDDTVAVPGDPLQRQLQLQESALLSPAADTPAPAQGPLEIQALGRARAASRERHRRQRIDKALTQTPSDAGPLNSHRLVTRAISTLLELSPAYLDHFVNYVETLMALEKLDRKRSP